MKTDNWLVADLLDCEDPHRQPSFTRQNRLGRTVWGLVYLLLFRSSLRPLHAWRCWLLRLFGATIAPGVHIYPSVRIWAPWNLVMDAESCLGDRVNCYNIAPVKLGKRAIVSQDVTLCTGSHDYRRKDFRLIAAPIVIGDAAWVCAEAFVGPGVSIGDSSIIGARAVVLKDMPSGQVCAGNPCQPIKGR